MSATLRHAVLDDIVARLIAADIVGSRVYKARLKPLFKGELPAILAYCPSERRSLRSSDSIHYEAAPLFVIEGAAKAETDELLEVALSELEMAIDNALMEDPDFLNANGIEQIMSIDVDTTAKLDGEKRFGGVKITLAAQWDHEYVPAVGSGTPFEGADLRSDMPALTDDDPADPPGVNIDLEQPEEEP